MSIKNILVAYSGEAARRSALKHGIKLAKLHEAWVTGVISHHGQPQIEERFGRRLPNSIIDEIRQLDQERIDNIKSGYYKIVEDAGLKDRADFIDLADEDVSNLSSFARMFDVVLMGQHSEDPNEAHLSAFPDRVALQSGRPVLIVPNGYESDKLADHALIAWDGKRSSARAIGDAMHYLETKPKVSILCIGKTAVPGTDHLMCSLKRHGVKPELIVKERNKALSNTILETADDIGAKLIVMGAYEQSKFTQDLFGGVTNEVMKNAKVPVFLSH
jgi:nucleotide-binding universal stress UspA family protein